MGIPEFSNRLRKVNVNPPLINEDIVHFIVGIDTRLFCLIFNKAVLERITSLPVPYHFARFDGTKSGEYQLQVMLLGHGI